MEFTPELPVSKGNKNILVVTDELATYTNVIPTSTSIAKRRTVIGKFGIPTQVIMDRDVCWTGRFWKESSNKISLQACSGLSRDNRVLQHNALAFSCNSTPHSATSFASAHEYSPITESAILPSSESMPGLSGPPPISRLCCSSIVGNILDNVSFHLEVQEMVEQLLTEQPKVLKLKLSFPKQADYQNQFSSLFPASLDGKRGRQRKFLMEDICCTWIHPKLDIALDSSKLRMNFWISFICQNFYYLLFHLSIAFHLLILLAFVIIASCVTPSVFKGFRSDCRQGGLCYGYWDSHPYYTTYAYIMFSNHS